MPGGIVPCRLTICMYSNGVEIYSTNEGTVIDICDNLIGYLDMLSV